MRLRVVAIHIICRWSVCVREEGMLARTKVNKEQEDNKHQVRNKRKPGNGAVPSRTMKRKLDCVFSTAPPPKTHERTQPSPQPLRYCSSLHYLRHGSNFLLIICWNGLQLRNKEIMILFLCCCMLLAGVWLMQSLAAMQKNSNLLSTITVLSYLYCSYVRWHVAPRRTQRQKNNQQSQSVSQSNTNKAGSLVIGKLPCRVRTARW